MMRKHSVVSSAAGLQPHDHISWRFNGLSHFARIAIAFFKQGIGNNQRLMYITEDPHQEDLAALGDIDELVDHGALQIASVAEVYGSDGRFQADEQLRTFTEALQQARVDGYQGLAVAADNSPLVQGSPEQVDRWMRWEYLADRFMSANPVAGLCGFNNQTVAREQLDDLATLHPIVSAGHQLPSFRLFNDGDGFRLIGSLDGLSSGQFRRVLGAAPPAEELIVDLTDTEFLNHSALIVLAELAQTGTKVEMKNADPIVKKIKDLIGLESPNLHLQYR